jgi:hypothetical protein
LLYVPLKNFSLIKQMSPLPVIRAAKFRPTLRALEEGETFIVPHLL